MALLRRVLLRLFNVFRPGRAEPDLSREVAAHLTLLEDEFQRRGMSPEDARLAARRAFGGVDQAKERQRDARSFLWLDDLRRDVGYALRTLARTPGFTAVAVLTLALGIGANTAIYSVLQAVWLDAVPFRDPGRLVVIKSIVDDSVRPVSAEHFKEWRAENRVFEEMSAFSTRISLLRMPKDPAIYVGARASASLFSVAGVPMALGRPLVPDDERADAPIVAVITHDFWRRKFGGDPQVLGRTLAFGKVAVTIVGVTPLGFNVAGGATAWLPYRPLPFQPELPDSLTVIARLKPGVSLAEARDNLNAISAALSPTDPDGSGDARLSVQSLREAIVGTGLTESLFLLFSATSIVLLIACANASNLLLARGAARHRELAVRRALGAGRHRIVRQLLAETGVIALAGAFLGVIVTFISRDALVGSMPHNVPRSDAIAIDWRVLTFTLSVAILATLVAGIVPALRSTAVEPSAALTDGSQASTSARRRGLANTLMIVEVSLSFVVLSVAGLLLGSFLKLVQINPGFNPEHVVTFRFAGGQDLSAASARAVLDALRHAPQVRAAGAIDVLPLSGGGSSAQIAIPGQPVVPPDEELVVDVHKVEPGYFEAMGIPVKAGRVFTDSDLAGTQSVVISNAAARKFWPGGSAIGRQIKFGGTDVTVVGIVEGVRDRGLADGPGLELYVPMTPRRSDFNVFVMRTDGTPLTVFNRVKPNVEAIAGLSVTDVRTLDEHVLRSVHEPRFRALLFTLMGVLVVALTAIGIFSVTAHAVVQRRREMGIRLAVGATRGQIIALILRQTAVPITIGMALGLVGALSTTRAVAHFLYSTTPTDPATFATVVALVGLTALVAVWIPATRALRLDPVAVLRAE